MWVLGTKFFSPQNTNYLKYYIILPVNCHYMHVFYYSKGKQGPTMFNPHSRGLNPKPWDLGNTTNHAHIHDLCLELTLCGKRNYMSRELFVLDKTQYGCE